MSIRENDDDAQDFANFYFNSKQTSKQNSVMKGRQNSIEVNQNGVITGDTHN